MVEVLEGHSDPAIRTHAAADLKHRIKSSVGISVAIRVADPGGVPRSQGKAVRIVDSRPKG